jgi:hypothetical protein
MAYVTILESEFDAIFLPEKGWQKEITPGQKEIVYVKSMKSKPNLQFKIYSSIHQNNSLSRPCGKDAIRVCVINTATNKGVRKSNRINRVPGWDVRLKARVESIWMELINN